MQLGIGVERAVGIAALMVLSGCAAEAGSYSRAPSSSGTSTPTMGTGSGAGVLTAGVWDDNLNYEHFSAYREASSVRLPFEAGEHDAAHTRFDGQREGHALLDVALVIDATGSMGDEITYLKAELDSIASRVAAAYPEADTRWALVMYRDEGDEYVTRVLDFTDVASMRASLAMQSAGGGGDYPEASHAALRDMTNLSFREGDDVARLAFWVADAPHHDSVVREWAEAVRTAAQLDVHVYPVASSGVDGLTELSMRSAAQLTGGRYLFLTDDSGVGGSHLEPTIPCYVVTRLVDAMLRMIDSEMSGSRIAPSSEAILRTSGEPVDGLCTTEEGVTARAY